MRSIMTQPGRVTKRSIQVAVRLPLELHAALLERGGSVAGQLIDGARKLVDGAAVTGWSPPLFPLGIPAPPEPQPLVVNVASVRRGLERLSGATKPDPVEDTKRKLGSLPEKAKREAPWTAGANCPKCGFLLRNGRCSNKPACK